MRVTKRLLKGKAVSLFLSLNNMIPFIDFLINLYKEDRSKHISLIKLIEVTNDNKNREVFYNLT